jgi:hypothetical protein
LRITGRGRPTLGLAAVAATLIAACACSSSGGNESQRLPPNDKEAIEKVFRSELDRLGLHLTRGALVDVDSGRPTSKGTHLAVYVEPVGPYSADDYAGSIVAVTKVFAPRSFDTWSGLVSFDVCQEPLPGVDTRREPPPKTKVDMTRNASEEVDWDDLDLRQLLIDEKRLGKRELSVYGDTEVRRTTVYQDAQVQAQESSPSRNAPAPPPPPSPSY